MKSECRIKWLLMRGNRKEKTFNADLNKHRTMSGKRRASIIRLFPLSMK